MSISTNLAGSYEHMVHQNALALHGHAILVTLPNELDEKQFSLDHPLIVKGNGCSVNT